MSQTITRRVLGAALVSIAMRFKGVREEPLGSNSGPMVRKFQAATPLGKTDPTGWPWCAAYLAYIFQLLWHELGVGVLPIWNPSASCDVLLAWARKKGILYAANAADAKRFRAKLSKPEPYDVFLSMKHAGDATHTGLVTDVQADLDIETIEGNTNTGGSREGVGVFTFVGGNARHEEGRCYIRFLELMPVVIAVSPPVATALLPGVAAAAPKPAAPRPAPKAPKAPRLIVSVPPYQEENYIALPSARLENGSWVVDGVELSNALLKADLPLSLCTTRTQDGRPVVLPGRAKLRDHLRMAGIVLDETRTRLGNHTSDANDPRQYAFIASGVNKE